LKCTVAFRVFLGVDLGELVQEFLRVFDLGDRVGDQPVVVSGLQHAVGSVPHILETAVEVHDLAFAVDDDDPVTGGVQCGAEEREALRQALALAQVLQGEPDRVADSHHQFRIGEIPPGVLGK
jgi:hypothetical protein